MVIYVTSINYILFPKYQTKFFISTAIENNFYAYKTSDTKSKSQFIFTQNQFNNMPLLRDNRRTDRRDDRQDDRQDNR